MGAIHCADSFDAYEPGSAEQDKADKHRKRALIHAVKHFGESHSTTLSSINEVAVGMMVRGDFVGPIPLFEKVLRLRGSGDSECDKMTMAVNMMNLANCYVEDGTDSIVSKGASLIEQVIGIRIEQAQKDGASLSTLDFRRKLGGPLAALHEAYCKTIGTEAADCKLTKLCQDLGLFVRLSNSQGGPGQLFGKKDAPKQKPNEQCLCGSGRKYKKCCKP
jgi:hypothetical protein